MSPFLGLPQPPNATLVFDVIDTTSAPTIDVDGNPVYLTSTFTVIATLAKLKTSNRARRDIEERPPGVDLNARFLSGWAVIPMALPSGVKLEAWAKCTLTTELGVQEGRYNLSAKSISPWGDEQITGQFLEGWFEEIL